MTALVQSIDHFRSERRPLYFVVPLKGGRAWQWSVTEFRLSDGYIHARLCAPEHEDDHADRSIARPDNAPALIWTG
jgi:hypothetical protein